MSLPDIKTILYTTSLSSHSRLVFRHAVKIAGVHNAKIVMLHVVEPIGITALSVIRNYLPKDQLDAFHDKGMEEIKANMKERVVQFYEEELKLLENQPALEIEQVVSEGSRSDEIVTVANAINADLILMGSHNSLGRSSRTTRQVIKYAARPVMVVPTRS